MFLLDHQLPRPSDVLAGVNSIVIPLARRGWLAPPGVGAGVVLLETTGRRSGRRTRRPVLAIRAGDRVVVGTIRARSDWIANLAADPSAIVTVRGRRRAADAEVRRTERCGSLAVLQLGTATTS